MERVERSGDLACSQQFDGRFQSRILLANDLIESGRDYDLWLDPVMMNVEAVSEMLKPCDARTMRSYPVSTRVNLVANDDAECSTPVKLALPQSALF